MQLVTVYVAALDHVGAKAGIEQPAFRAWADALLRARALTLDLDLATAVAKRSVSQIGRLVPEGLYVHPIAVDPAPCAAAVASDKLELFFPPAWSEGLAEYLVDRGYDRDMIEEHILPCAAPFVPIMVEQMREVLAGTRADLVEEVSNFFAEDISAYLASWRVLTAGALSVGQDLEIIVSGDAENAFNGRQM